MTGKAHAYIDESGQRSLTLASSDYFVLGAVVFLSQDFPQITSDIAALRKQLNRQPGDHLHWVNLRGYAQRRLAIQGVAKMPVTAMTVVISKRHLTAMGLKTEDRMYMYAFRLLLERISWWGKDNDVEVSYVLAHIQRFQIQVLREYEKALKLTGDSSIYWGYLDPKGGSIDQPKRLEQLQLADFVASATAMAFEPDAFGNVEISHLMELVPVIYCRTGRPLTSYGLKMLPWDQKTRTAHPWAAVL